MTFPPLFYVKSELIHLFMRIKLALLLTTISSMSYAKGGTYFSTNVGLGFMADTSGTSKTDFDKVDLRYTGSYHPGFNIGTAVGYNFSDVFALELSTEYNSNKTKHEELHAVNPSQEALFRLNHLKSDRHDTIMSFVNGYYLIPHGNSPLKPYIGAGIGYAYAISYSNVTSGGITQDGLVAQGLIGLKYELTDRFDLFTDFRYVYGKLGNYKYQLGTIRIGTSFKI